MDALTALPPLPLRHALTDTARGDGPREVARVVDPWRGELVGEVELATAEDAERAAAAATRAFARSRRLAAFERKRMLRALGDEVRRDAEALAELIAREAGKPITLARAEVRRAQATLELGAEEATRLGGEVVTVDVDEASAGYVARWTRVPAGPVIAFSPFNFPLNLVCHKLAPALAAGCPVVLKPPPQAPLTSLRLAMLAARAGVDPELFQVLPCTNDVAERLARDERFAVLSFTGSARVGWWLKSIAGRKRVLLELGGNAASIVHEDADLAWAVGRLATAAFAYAGQVCISAQRVYVHAPVWDAVAAALADRARAIAPRDPLDAASLVGPLIDEAAAIRCERWIDEALAAGATRLAGAPREGNRLAPALVAIEGEGRGLALVDEEAFGPVLTLHRYETWNDGLTAANRGRYGLQASVFTRDVGRIEQASRELEVGAVIVNDAPFFRVDAMPYGGVRDSGLGREGVRYAIEDLTERRLVVVRA